MAGVVVGGCEGSLMARQGCLRRLRRPLRCRVGVAADLAGGGRRATAFDRGVKQNTKKPFKVNAEVIDKQRVREKRCGRLKIYRRKSCGFDPHPGYQLSAGATSFSLKRLARTTGGRGKRRQRGGRGAVKEVTLPEAPFCSASKTIPRSPILIKISAFTAVSGHSWDLKDCPGDVLDDARTVEVIAD